MRTKTKAVASRVSDDLYQEMIEIVGSGRVASISSIVHRAVKEWIARDKARAHGVLGANCPHCGAWIAEREDLGVMGIPFEERAPGFYPDAGPPPLMVVFCQSCKSILSVQQ